MQLSALWTGLEWSFAVKMALALVAGVLIGIEREARDKPAGISTQSLVIGGSALFTMLSVHIAPGSPDRVAAQIVTGVGFLGGGIILKSEGGTVTNLTTAASIWYSAALGMAIGFGWYLIAVLAIAYAIIVPRIPNYYRWKHPGSP
jgi:putative Mg2+ transporter-C (MgtC) family protein